MSDWPVVSVLIPTYNRPVIVQTAVDRLRQNLQYAGELEIIVGNDGEPIAVQGAQLIDEPSGSLGANLNRLINAANGDLLFQMDDDHWLIEPLDLTPHVEKLMIDPCAGWIRLMGVAGHNYRLRMDMLPYSKYLIVEWTSPETYITSNRPHLKKREFHTRYGFYGVGLKLGQTEESFCMQCRTVAVHDSQPFYVMIPLDVHTESAWQHVGESWQQKGF